MGSRSTCYPPKTTTHASCLTVLSDSYLSVLFSSWMLHLLTTRLPISTILRFEFFASYRFSATFPSTMTQVSIALPTTSSSVHRKQRFVLMLLPSTTSMYSLHRRRRRRTRCILVIILRRMRKPTGRSWTVKMQSRQRIRQPSR